MSVFAAASFRAVFVIERPDRGRVSRWLWRRLSIVSYLVSPIGAVLFPYFLLTVTILIFASFVFINDISRMETKKADRISASYLRDSVDRTIKEAELSVLEAVERSDIYKLYFNNQGEPEQGTVYAVAQSLRNMMKESSYIQSVYLYDRVHGSVLTDTGLKELEGFFDEDWIKAMTSTQCYRKGGGRSGSIILTCFSVPPSVC